ncbi:hypothetical protein AB6O49_31240 [Streptomyces sp. SBR177]
MSASVDVVRESARAGRVVVWEESARDGAQAKTLMSADFRVRLARETGGIFGADGPRHVVFAAGFPAVCAEEYEAVRRVAAEAEGAVSVAAVCRGTRRDVEQAVASVRGGRHARVMMVVPASEAMAQVMVHRPPPTRCRPGSIWSRRRVIWTPRWPWTSASRMPPGPTPRSWAPSRRP